MSFIDDLLRTLRSPLDFVRGKTSLVRNAEGSVVGSINRVRNLPQEFKGEYEYNKAMVRNYKDRGKALKGKAQERFGKGGTPNGPDAQQAQGQAPLGGPAVRKKAKMGLFSKKKRCPNCDEKLDARWELCPYCGFGGQASAPQVGSGGPPRTQALEMGSVPDQGGGNKPRTMALDIGSGGGGGGNAGPSANRLVAWLIPLDGPQGGQLLELRARAIVGTAPDCDVIVKDASVSGRHAELSAQGGAFRVSDLGSTNGTFVNEKRVQNAELVDGDTLRLGRTPFKFKST